MISAKEWEEVFDGRDYEGGTSNIAECARAIQVDALEAARYACATVRSLYEDPSAPDAGFYAADKCMAAIRKLKSERT